MLSFLDVHLTTDHTVPIVPGFQMVEVAESRFGDAAGSGTDDEVKTEKQFTIRAEQTQFTAYHHKVFQFCMWAGSHYSEFKDGYACTGKWR